MARKQYEMELKLAASLNSRFGSTFSSAQQQLAKMQNELQSLNRLQGDISAYQKQQQAVEASRNKLELLQQQYDNIQKEIQETGTYSSDLQNKLLAKEKQIDQTRAKMESYERQLSQTGDELRRAGVNTADLSGESARLSREYDALKGKQGEVARGFQEGGQKAEAFGDASVEAVQSVQEVLAAAGITMALKEIAGAYMECVNQAGEFQSTMSAVEALSGSNAQEMEELAETAKYLGATTQFTAKQSADAMTYMAMAGWDAQQMISGMDGVLQLAAASGEDLAMVSDIVTDNLTAFGMKASDTSHFADVLAAAATSSNTSVSIMGETFKNCASLAGALGYSVEDVAVAVGLMANAGIKGSNAGTALKNIFSNLIETFTLSGSAIGEVEYSAINADGTMKSFGQTITDLREYFSQMTGAEKMQNAEMLVGQRAMAGFVDLMNATDDDFDSLTRKINDCSGAAQKMADIRLDNMNGQLTLMQSAWEGLQITIGEQFTPVMSDVYGMLAGVFTEVNDFVKANPQVVKAVTVIALAVGGFAAALTAYTIAAKLAKTAQAALNAVMDANPVFLLVTAFAALTGLVAGFIAIVADANSGMDDLTGTSRRQEEELNDLRQEYEEVASSQGALSTEALRLKNELDDMEASFDSNKQTVREFLEECESAVQESQEIAKSYREGMDAIGDEEIEVYALIQRLEDLSSANGRTAASEQEMMALVDRLNQTLPELGLNYEDVAQGTLDWAAAAKKAADMEVQRRRQAQRQETYVDASLQIEENAKQLEQMRENIRLQRELEGFSYNSSVGAWTSAGGVNEMIGGSQALIEMIQEYEDLQEAQKGQIEIVNEIRGEWDEEAAAVREAADANAELERQQQAVNDVLAPMIEKIQELGEAYEEAYNSALSSFQGQFGLFDQASTESEAYMNATVANAQAALDSQLSYWNSYSANLEVLRNTSAADLGITQENYDLMMSYVQDGSEEAAGLAASMVKAIQDGDADALTDLATTAGQVQAKQLELAEYTAEWQTGFSETLQQMQEELETTVANMDLNDEAARSGASTVQGFIDAADEALPKVQNAYARLATAAVDALRTASGANLSLNIPGYAVGTRSAAPGFALVGENGPELVYFNGGEQVMTAEETASMREDMQVAMIMPQMLAQIAAMSASMYTPAIASSGRGTPVYLTVRQEISAGGDTEALRAALDDGAEAVREAVRQVMEEIDEDRERTRY